MRRDAIEVEQQSGQIAIDTATLDLLARWRHEGETEDCEQLRLAEQDLADFKREMNAERIRSGEPLLYP